MEPQRAERRINLYDDEIIQQQYRHAEEEEKHQRHYQKTMHRTKRSDSRASDASDRADKAMAHMHEEVDQAHMIQDRYDEAVQQINRAVDKKSGGRPLSSHGIDQVRNEMIQDNHRR